MAFFIFHMIKQQSTSPRSLSRLFSDDDTTFSDFLRYQRIIRSLELMADNTMSLKEIAYDTGFSTPANFNRSFKMVLGIAPSEMRRRQREWYNEIIALASWIRVSLTKFNFLNFLLLKGAHNSRIQNWWRVDAEYWNYSIWCNSLIINKLCFWCLI